MSKYLNLLGNVMDCIQPMRFAVKPLHALMPLIQEIAELKRVTSAQMQGKSVASVRFGTAWRKVVAGEDMGQVARQELAVAMLHTALGPIDDAALSDAGVSPQVRTAIYRQALTHAFSQMDMDAPAVLHDAARAFVNETRPDAKSELLAPAFIPLLAAQPRAGAVAADARRLVLTPQENHAEHCWTVAVIATLLAMFWHEAGEEDVLGDAFILGLAHHFPNAWLPDGGFAAEVVLGAELAPIFARLNARALAMLPAALAQNCHRVLSQKDTDTVALGQIFNAADVIDRVLQQSHHAAQASFRVSDATETRGLVHEGPLQAFHTRILSQAGLL